MSASSAARPLSAHQLFHSTDLEEARDRVAAVFCPHRLDTIGRGASLDARHHRLSGGRLSLNYIEYGAKTLISPGELGQFYLLQIPLAGGAAIVNGADRYYSSPDAGAILNPQVPTTMIWEEGTRQVLVQIDRKAMQDHLSAHLGARADRPLSFRGALDLTRGAGAALRQLLLFLVSEADAGRAPIGEGLMGRAVESAVMSGLLATKGHDYAAHLDRRQAAPRPRHLRLAETYIEAHLAEPLSVEHVASVVGISVRGLQLAFRHHHGTTPLAFWRDLRLARAHAELVAGSGSVTEVALRWGFTHFGRFAETYRARFGLSPRDTLRAAGGIGYQE